MGPRMRASLGVLWEAVPVVAVACLVFLLIRTHLLEYYRIPSQSMAPTLHGDVRNGDLVLVNKTAFWFQEPEPFDMVVVQARQSHHSHIVKRIVAVGPVSVTIQGGDLFLGSVEGGLGKRVVKNPQTYADMRVPVFRHPSPPGAETLTDFFRIPPGQGGLVNQQVQLLSGGKDLSTLATALDPQGQQRRMGEGNLDSYLPGHMSTRKAIDTSYLDPQGRRQPADRGSYQVGYQPDIGMSLDLNPNPGVTGFQVVMEQRSATVAVAYEIEGRGRLLVDGAPVGEEFSGPKLRAQKHTQVTFGYLDGHCFLIVADQVVLHRELQLPTPRRISPRPNGLHFAVAGNGAIMKIPRIVVFHDVHYQEDQARTLRRGSNEPYIVQKGCMFLLGDNTRDSQDSRDFETDAFRLDDLVGRPIAVLAPTSRSRMLLR